MNNIKLEKIINKKLNSNKYKDNIFNGLQIEGKKEINKIITGVSICEDLIKIAILKKADAIIVHHGMFWNKENKVINGIKRKRLKLILSNNINLYCWHLPLDCDEKIGNNVQIAKKLDIKIMGKINYLLLWGIFKNSISYENLSNTIKKLYFRKPFFYKNNNINHKIKKISWCSGKGQNLILDAANFGIDAFLTGEVSEETVHYANENNIYFFSAGHHATEIDGIKKLGEWLNKKYYIDVNFVNINNPI
ncbi:Nif3-like dinuclear metal center hexameric protein [Buchnera aphidicola (Ceratoglyphina bambusae)]|uniref:Nif3-like dinuclear metal center hexameric protein n=1 Tax=Buchnera aphidicola TaxID=9 RepID=UPI0031B83531